MVQSFFNQLSDDCFAADVVIIDIDGCLVPDGALELDSLSVARLNKLNQTKEVFLLSNKKNHERNNLFASLAGIKYLKTNLRKPNPQLKSLLRREIVDFDQKTKLVVGDKYLTDGLFAKAIGAEFLKVKRLVGTNVSLVVKLIDWCDDLVSTLAVYLKLSRPNQWLKNVLILAPALFAHQLASIAVLKLVFLGVLIFSMLASSVYVFNDWFDVATDRLHPKKKKRPLASGEASIDGALIFGALLMFGALGLTVVFLPATLGVVIGYLVLNLLYSTYLKQIVILDVITVAVFYLMRIIYGGLITSVPISSWLILCTIFLATFVIIGKRLGEAKRVDRRAVLDKYPDDLLAGLLLVVSALTILSYGIYTIDGVRSQLMVYSNLPVIIGVFRFIYLTKINVDTESPELLIFKDAGIFWSVVGWLVVVISVFYYQASV